MKAIRSVPQLEMAVADPAAHEKARQAEADEQALLYERVVHACRALARELTMESCATQIDAIWGDRGHPVSAAVLRAALGDSRGNYFRFEWAVWFARQDGGDAVAELLLEIAGRGLSPKKPEDELRDLHEAIRNEFPKQAEKLIRKGKAPR